MKILVINHEFPPVGGGAGTACYNTCRGLASLGIEVDVITSAFRDLPRHEIVDGVSVVRVPALRKKPLESTTAEIASFFLSASAEASRSSLMHPPDLIHTYFGLPSGAIGWSIRKLLKVPYLISFRGRDVHGGHAKDHEGIQGPMRWLSRPVWRSADALVANSEGLRDIALNVLPDADVGVIPNGIDTAKFYPEAKGPRPTVKALYVGRLEPYKGIHDLLEATRLARSAGAPLEVSIVGDGSLKSELERYTIELGLSECVRFSGHVGRNLIPAIYRKADFLVLPSIVEGMSNAVLEAMASGLPILGTRIPGSEELVDTRNGVLVEPSDPIALATEMIGLCSDSPLRTRMGRQSRIKALNRSWNSVAEAYVSVYRRLTGEKRRCAA